jgi:hypothetical protein
LPGRPERRRQEDLTLSLRNRPAGILILIAIWALVPLPAPGGECEGCDYGERGDRMEGIHSEKIPISGESVPLLSVEYAAKAAPGSEMRLYFWLPEAGAPEKLKVWRPLASDDERELVEYRMQPKAVPSEQGLQKFAWPRGDVLDRIELEAGSLYVLINAGGTYLPGLVTTADSAAGAGGYEFWFDSPGEILADCFIERADGDAAQPIRRWDCSAGGGRFPVEWDGLDKDDQPAPEGRYVLRFDGEIEVASGNSRLERTVTFWHRSPLE